MKESGVWAQLIPTQQSEQKTWDLVPDIISIGRNSSNIIRLDFLAVSGLHCRIWREKDENGRGWVYWLEDKSTNGTFVDFKVLYLM